MAYTFRERVLDPSKRVLIYEVVPPEPHTTVAALRRSALTLAKTLEGFNDVSAIYVPEVVEEEGSRVVRHLKVPARTFASFVRSSYDGDEGHRKKLIISHPFSYTPKEQTESWLEKTYKEGGIKNLIAVGPRHQTRELPGYSVVETLRLISDMNAADRLNIFAGAICMDTRRKSSNPGLEVDEPARMVRKAEAGAMFFVSQICFDAESMIDLLKSYRAECDRNDVQPRRVFIGTSPISSTKTLEVIDDLIGKPLDQSLRGYLFRRDHGIGNRSIQRIEEMFRRIFDFCYGENLGVPLGVCVEHVTDSNFRYAFELLYSLPQIWKEYHPDSEFPERA